MTVYTTQNGRRIVTDGGVEPSVTRRTVHAKDVVTREVNGDDVEMLRVPISSTRTDREGDKFAKECLDGMAEQIQREQPLVFQNHGLAGDWMSAIPYDQAESIGTHMDAEVEQAEDGEYDLYAYVNPDGTHPEGERMLRQVRDEYQSVKFSVGFGVLDYAPITDDAGNEIGREFLSADLMEDSKVGIPANPDASVTMSAKGNTPMHPMVALMQQMNGGIPEGQHSATQLESKTVTDGGDNGESKDDDGDREGLTKDAALEALAEEYGKSVDELTDTLESDAGAVEKDDPEPEYVRELRESEQELREEIKEIRENIGERGTPKSKDTNTQEPNLTDDGESEESKDTDADTGDNEFVPMSQQR